MKWSDPEDFPEETRQTLRALFEGVFMYKTGNISVSPPTATGWQTVSIEIKPPAKRLDSSADMGGFYIDVHHDSAADNGRATRRRKRHGNAFASHRATRSHAPRTRVPLLAATGRRKRRRVANFRSPRTRAARSLRKPRRQ